MTLRPRRRAAGPVAALVVAAVLAAGVVGCSADGSDDAGASSAGSDAGAGSGGTATSTTVALEPQPEARGEVLVVDDFDRPDGVVTDERNWHDDTLPPDDAIWAATSGVLHAADGEGWSDSRVFRMVTHRKKLGDVAVSLRLRTEPPVGDEVHPEEAWDGVHLLLRYQDEADLYAVSVARRDGELAIKRKDPGGPSNGGTYTTLATGPGAVQPGIWTDVVVTIRSTDEGVELTVGLDGKPVLRTVDAEAVGDRASKPGRVGVRADNTTFRLDDVVVRELEP